MTIESFDIIFYTAIFVLPGFIINSFIDSINPSTKLSKEPYFLKCLLFSLCNCGVWSWLYIIVIKNKKLTLPWNWLLLLVISIVGSLIIGFILSVFKQKQLSQRFLSKFNIRTINSIPTAWDYYFSKLDSTFLIITLMDDTKLYGWYSTESFSSSNPEEETSLLIIFDTNFIFPLIFPRFWDKKFRKFLHCISIRHSCDIIAHDP